jgi:hypothetical protein
VLWWILRRWGSTGFAKLSLALSKLARAQWPKLRTVLSNWGFDDPSCGEYDGLDKFIDAHPGFASFTMSDSGGTFPSWPLAHERGPGSLPLLNFPEVSMHGRSPWGGFGANPMPKHYQSLWDAVAGLVHGGMPYSEGIYDDINSAVCFQHYWSDRPANNTVLEYAQFEYGLDAAALVVAAIELLETTYPMDPGLLCGNNLCAQAQHLLKQAEGKMSLEAKAAWRWKILMDRANIDVGLNQTGGVVNGTALQAAFADLTAIYYAENAESQVRPLRPGQHIAVGPDHVFKTCPMDKERGPFVPWVRAENMSNIWGSDDPNAGAPFAPLLGIFPTEAGCRSACEADTNCTQYSWNSALPGWKQHCYGRCDSVWSLHPVSYPLSGIVAARRVNAKTNGDNDSADNSTNTLKVDNSDAIHGDVFHPTVSTDPRQLLMRLRPTHTMAALRSVSPGFVSFALDAELVVQIEKNNRFVNFSDPLLRKVTSLASGGYLRLGGTFTDFVIYEVPGTNYTDCRTQARSMNRSIPNQCPYNVCNTQEPCDYACCMPLSMQRWRAVLEFGHATGLQVTLNLNLLAGRWKSFTAMFQQMNGHFDECAYPPSVGYCHAVRRPVWDPSNTRALMEWTVGNVPRQQWPSAFGLGNELQYYLTPQQLAEDFDVLHRLVAEVFSDPAHRPMIYGPCNAVIPGQDWSHWLLNNLSKLNPHALDAYSYHSYNHNGGDDANVAALAAADVVLDRDREFMQNISVYDYVPHKPSGTKQLWITETAWTVTAPRFNASIGGDGPSAEEDGMGTVADLAWSLSSMGAAAEVGVSVFGREDLTGDYLETIGSWQNDGMRLYTPHPDFWLMALWNKLCVV